MQTLRADSARAKAPAVGVQGRTRRRVGLLHGGARCGGEPAHGTAGETKIST